MIEIIKNTMIEPIKMECSDCQSIFTYTYEDIRTEETMNLFGTPFYNRFVQCPVCRYRNYINQIRVKGGKEE